MGTGLEAPRSLLTKECELVVTLEDLTVIRAPIERCFDLARVLKYTSLETSIQENRLSLRPESPLD